MYVCMEHCVCMCACMASVEGVTWGGLLIMAYRAREREIKCVCVWVGECVCPGNTQLYHVCLKYNTSESLLLFPIF